MAARQFGVSLLASRWSQITNSTTKNMNVQALLEVQEMFFLLWPICYTSNVPVFNQIQCKCELHDQDSNDSLLLKSEIILHELRHILNQTRSHGDNFGASNIEHRRKFM